MLTKIEAFKQKTNMQLSQPYSDHNGQNIQEGKEKSADKRCCQKIYFSRNKVPKNK